LTKAQFVKQADAICRSVDQRQEAALGLAEKTSSGDGGPKVEQAILIAGLGPIQVAAEEIGDLGAPSGDEDQVAAIVQGLEGAVAKAEANPQGMEGAFAEVDKLSASYGLKDCSEPL